MIAAERGHYLCLNLIILAGADLDLCDHVH